MEAKIIQKQKISYLALHFKKLILLIVIIIFAIGYFTLLSPKYKQIQQDKREIAAKDTEQDSLRKKLTQMIELRNAYKSIDENELKRIGTALPDLPLKDELLPQLEALISKNGLLLVSLHVEDLQKADTEKKIAPGVGKIKITMDVMGTDYYNLKNLLTVLEKNLRLLDVTKLKFSPDGESVNLEMITYYMK